MIQTPVCNLLGIELPIFLGGMGSIYSPSLVAAVSNAGGLGAMGCHSLSAEQVRTGAAAISKLTDRPRGNTGTLRCQYHGWEYTKDGRTGKIPDARAFRPWDRENSCLRRFRVEKCGDLVFVNFSDNGVSLREWIGPLWELWSSYGVPYRHAATWGDLDVHIGQH